MGFFRWLSRLITLLVVLGMLAGLAAGAGAIACFLRGPSTEAHTVMIARGSNLTAIGEQLQTENLVSSKWLFVAAVVASGQRGELKAGEYAFPAGITIAGIISQMVDGKVVVHKVTVVEGMTVADVLALLKADDALAGPIEKTPAEGTLLPETYYFNRGDSRAALLARMHEAQQLVLNEAWAQRTPGLPLASPQEALTLASVVEKETGIPSERARVAGVFINRLRLGMKLQSDPTVIYPLSRGTGDLGRLLTRKDLDTPSPYNTYYVVGLPAGPIANPGRASILAATQPEKHNYLYFVADGSGGHAFASTLEAHNANVAKWRALGH